MLDIKLFRENAELIKANLKKKFQEDRIAYVDEIVEKDIKTRELMKESETLRHKRNTISEQISQLKKEKKNADTLLAEAKDIPKRIVDIEAELEVLKERVKTLQMLVPNIIHESVPIGKDSTGNVEVEKIGLPKKFDFPVKSHVEIAEELDIADFEGSARTSGNGFFFLKNDLAILNMALINFARDYMVKQGYNYIEPPLMISGNVLNGVYSHAEIEQMSYKIEGEDLFLIATSEHALIGWFINRTIEESELPIKLTGYSMCFRKEIGSHGIDQKGLYRTHQFNKQEMIVICRPEDSYNFYNEMLNHSKEIFKELGIPVRILECCSGDLGDLKAKSADLEAWSPRKNEYFEVCSCSNLTDAQSRRLNIKAQGKDGKYLVHTLNNTVIATSRAMVAILENFQNKDGTVDIPKVLWPYMGGKKKIVPKKKDYSWQQ
jgi:seryl-tRNA synthetase